jgi:hypothetical protein
MAPAHIFSRTLSLAALNIHEAEPGDFPPPGPALGKYSSRYCEAFFHSAPPPPPYSFFFGPRLHFRGMALLFSITHTKKLVNATLEN